MTTAAALQASAHKSEDEDTLSVAEMLNIVSFYLHALKSSKIR